MKQLFALAVAATITSTAIAHAEGMEDVADAIKDGTGDPYTASVMTKLVTFNLGPKCWTKAATKDSGVINTGMHVTRTIAALAKQWTGDDWDRVKDAQVEPMIDAFKARFSITVNVDGDDCNAGRNSLWVRYWSDAVAAAAKYPPPAGKVFIKINVGAKTKDVVASVSKDGTTFTFDGAKDIEPKVYAEKIERPFRQIASKLDDDFAFLTMEATGKYHTAWVLTQLHAWKVGKKCYAKLADKDSGVHAASFATRDIAEYAKQVGAEDWDRIEGQSSGEPATNRELVANDIAAFKKRFSLTMAVDGDDCDASRSSILLRAWTTVTDALSKHPPKANKVAIKLALSAKAKDVGVTAAKDGATITITLPRDKEVVGWTDKIEKAFEKAARK